MTLKNTKFINPACASFSRCTEKSSLSLGKTQKKKKIEHKWILDPELSKCEEAGIRHLTYVEVKGILCGLSKMTTKTFQPRNNSEVWNSKTNICFRTEAVRDHFSETRNIKTMHDDAIWTKMWNILYRKRKERWKFI